MAEYSIKDLENFTNIKAHTLRIWEQRYKLLEPRRTSTNIRYYNDTDLKKILNVNLLYNNGYKISRIAVMSDEEIISKAKEFLLKENNAPQEHVSGFIKMILELDEAALLAKLSDLNAKLGTENLYTDVLVDLLKRIGELWQVDALSVTHEHFFSNLLRDFFIQEIAKIPPPMKYRAKIVLFLHEREMHELSLLFYNLYLRKRGYECYYLGQAVPLKDLKTFIEQMRPDYLFTSLIAEAERSFIAEWIKDITAFFPAYRIYIGGSMFKKYADLIPESVNQIQRVEDIRL